MAAGCEDAGGASILAHVVDGVHVKNLTIVTMLSVVLSACGAWSQTESSQPTLAITHISVIDATGTPVQSDMTVVIRKDRISGIGKSDRLKPPKDATIVDGTGKFLIPGLWDMHVHTIFGDWIPGGRDVSLPLFVANGVTGVRDMGGDLDTLLRWRAEIASGKLLGPRLVVAGPMLDGAKSHFPSSLSIATPEEGRKAVDDLKAHNADFIKVQSYIGRDAYFAVVEEAKKQKMTLVGHVPDVIRASEASDAGQKSIEHLTGIFEGCSTAEDEFLKGKKGPKRFLDTYSESNCRSLIARLAKNHTWQVPTLVWERGQWLVDDIDYSHDPVLKYAPDSWQHKSWPAFTKSIMAELDTDPLADRKQFVQKELDMVKAMRNAGVPFLAGTDTAAGVAVLPGFSLHTEMEYFVQAGLTPMEALQTATRNPAVFLGIQKEAGTVEKDKVANLVLLNANPLEDIRNTRKIEAVVLNGKLLTRSDLDGVLEKIAAYAAAH
ncbi:MAG TPA: amidohydrolase family protein [Candidatus Angelobacter sp.]|nr:amidohydrolase family protein [Candidatus Angelobacter sp.]